jgi:hypothetical protein
VTGKLITQVGFKAKKVLFLRLLFVFFFPFFEGFLRASTSGLSQKGITL